MARDEGGWVESTEGDLDYDLTEEAGWGGDWEPRDRAPMWGLARVLFALALLGMVGGTVIGWLL